MPGGPQDALLATITQSSLLLVIGGLLLLVFRRAGMPGGRVSAACAGGLLAGLILGPMVAGRVAQDLHEDLTIGGRPQRIVSDSATRQLLREVDMLTGIGVTPAAVDAHKQSATPAIATLHAAYATRVSSQHMVRSMILSVSLAVLGFAGGRCWHRRKVAATVGADGRRGWSVMVGGLGTLAVLGLQSVPISPATLAVHVVPVALAGTLLCGDLASPIRNPRLRGGGAGLSVAAILSAALLAVRVRDPLIFDGTSIRPWIQVSDETLTLGCAAAAVCLALATYFVAASVGVATAGVLGDSPRVRHALRSLGLCALVLLAGQSSSRAQWFAHPTFGLQLAFGEVAAMASIIGVPWVVIVAALIFWKSTKPDEVFRFARALGVGSLVFGGIVSLISTEPLFHALAVMLPVSGLTLGVCSDLLTNTRRTVSVQGEQTGVDTASY